MAGKATTMRDPKPAMKIRLSRGPVQQQLEACMRQTGRHSCCLLRWKGGAHDCENTDSLSECAMKHGPYRPLRLFASVQAPPTFVECTFGGQLASTVTCKGCGHSSRTLESFLDLSLPIPARPGSSSSSAYHEPAGPSRSVCAVPEHLNVV